MERPKHNGRVTEPPIISAQDVIARAKEAAEKASKGLKNPTVPAGTRRTDVKHGVCHGPCGRRRLINARTKRCHACFWTDLENILPELDAEALREREALAAVTE